MAEKLPIPLNTGLNNTNDRVLVSLAGYSSSNARFDKDVLEAECGYSIQINSAPGGTAYGLGFGRWATIEEYITVVGSSVYTASPTATAWTLIASGVASSNWEFFQYGPKIYAVNPTDGLVEHTIGGTDWSGQNKPVTPTSACTFDEVVFNSGHGYPDGSLRSYIQTSTWAASGEFASPYPVHQADDDFTSVFTFNKAYNYSQAHTKYQFQLTATLASSLDLSKQDYFGFGFSFDPAGTKSVLTNSLGFRMVNASGQVITPLVGNQRQIDPENHKRDFYFIASDRSKRAAVNKFVFDFGIKVAGGQSGNILATDTFTLELFCGDVWQNDNSGITVSDGPTLDSRIYGYTVKRTATGTESDLSPSTESPKTPTKGIFGQYFPSSYTRVYTTNVTSGGLGGSDTLQLYRQAKADRSWRLIGSTSNAASAYIDDHYKEDDLPNLTRGNLNANLPTNTKPQAIGRFRGSLVLGIGPDVYISRPGLPNEFEDINAAPESDFPEREGRSVYADDSQSENVITINGLNILYMGTKHRLYASFGDFPYNMSAPRPIDNIGPIGNRTAITYEQGLAFLDNQGVWYSRFSDIVTSQVGSIESQELSQNIGTSYSNFAVTSGAVLVESEGDLLAFSGSKYLRFDRRFHRWSAGTLYHNVVAAQPDYSLHTRLLTNDGRLLKWHGYDNTTSQTYAGSSINWTYETGDITFDRARITGIEAVVTGAPTLRITTFNGAAGSGYIDYTLTEGNTRNTPIDAGRHEGSKFRFGFSGTQADSVQKIRFLIEAIGGNSL